jgi:dihydrofolate reductase
MSVRKLIFATNISLDGYADHTVAIAADDELHHFFSGLLDQTGIQLFGRVTYQMMASYWPHAHEDPNASVGDLGFAERFNAVPKIVFSSTLDEAAWNNTTLVRSSAPEYVAKLKGQAGKDLYVGGIQLARALMSQGLVDEYWLLIHPVVVGSGRRLFENGIDQVKLRLIESRVFQSGVVALHYTRR